MSKTKIVKGFKVFNSDWTCRGKKYICPGRFEENVTPSACNQGMHFCKKAADCFNYYGFSPNNRVAEVAAYGTVVEEGDKCCTDKLEIIREIPLQKLLEIVNIGKGCTGFSNRGDRNSGNCNSGNCNSSDCNSGDRNSGNCNSGDYNSGNYNIGDYNIGDWNSGNWNSGNWNSGDYNSGNYNIGNYNIGDYNIGDYNIGNRNSGNCNSGDYNSGNCNSGNYNSGNCNSGNRNSGDWNKTDYSAGCFNTTEQKIHLFNKLSDWTFSDWDNSAAKKLLIEIPKGETAFVHASSMSESEKAEHPEIKTTGGYLKTVSATPQDRQKWWDTVEKDDKECVFKLPNFDPDIFEEITWIHTHEEWEEYIHAETETD